MNFHGSHQAQIDMQNGTTEKGSLKGIIHRTEGLHLCMNICKYIMDYFYSKSSVRDEGTLYNLKVLLNRKDIKLDMTNGYNSCKYFIDDVLDSHIVIVAAALKHFNIESIDIDGNPPLPNTGVKIQSTSFCTVLRAQLLTHPSCTPTQTLKN
jgi:hypothetical protein